MNRRGRPSGDLNLRSVLDAGQQKQPVSKSVNVKQLFVGRQQTLPKTDFLTKIDVIIVITIVTLGSTGLATNIIVWIDNTHQGDTEEEEFEFESNSSSAAVWNQYFSVALGIWYMLSNVIVFAPACWRWWTAVTALNKAGSIARPTVERGFSYFLIGKLIPKEVKKASYLTRLMNPSHMDDLEPNHGTHSVGVRHIVEELHHYIDAPH
eukprot:SAG22_NODE_2014_length_3140_cov_2.829990_5_plen_208_part_00